MTMLIQWSGVALVIAGILWAVTSAVHPNNGDPNATRSRLWAPVLGGHALSFLLLVLGFVGLHVRQAESAGVIGLIGFILALLGSALTFAIDVNMAFLLPPLNAQQPVPLPVTGLVGPSGPLRWLSLLTMTHVIFFVPGGLLTGIAVVRAGVLPAWAGWLLVIGTVVSNAGAFYGPLFILRKIGGVLFGGGLAWLGAALLAG
jgi:hypothetical protein